VEVLTEPVEDGAAKLMRYNVNGIVLDSPAFLKLKSELALHRVRINDKVGSPHYYHVGRYLDRLGATHWLVVREAQVMVWEGDVTDALDPEGRKFYEVITNPKLVARVRAKLSSKGRVASTGTSG